MDDLEPRRDRGDFPVWAPADGVAFVGRGADLPRHRVLAAATGVERPVAWARQVHGSACVAAREGPCGEADALTSRRADLALAVSTADCVPVVLASPTQVTAIHAGWRGIVAGVVPRAVECLADLESTRAWIGPAIGACCYEVGLEVAEQVVAASGDRAVLSPAAGPGGPHLDLARAVRRQLEASGVPRIATAPICTRCDLAWHSYRRDGAAAGRNLAFAWLPAPR